MDHLCYLLFVFVVLSSLFIAAFWSPEGKEGPTFMALVCVFIVILLLSLLVFWDGCGA